MAYDEMMDEEPDDQQDAVSGAPADKEDSGTAPIVIPKSACPGHDIQPGDIIKLRVEKVLEDEFLASVQTKTQSDSNQSSDAYNDLLD